MAAIEEGSLSFEALKRKIGVGTGNCRAKRCRPKIEERIKDHKATTSVREGEQSTRRGGNEQWLVKPLLTIARKIKEIAP